MRLQRVTNAIFHHDRKRLTVRCASKSASGMPSLFFRCSIACFAPIVIRITSLTNIYQRMDETAVIMYNGNGTKAHQKRRIDP